VHRLDIQTSGVLLMAKTLHCAQELTRAFQDRHIQKNYSAVVHGHIMRRGTITQSLERNGARMEISSHENALSARTTFQPQWRGHDQAKNPITLVSLSPKTGRMHQLRAHMAWLGHPILNDPVYGTPDHGLLALHCAQMTFRLHNQEYAISAPEPQAFLHHMQQG
jgi:23S rRNA-/tRNA-specific pseudouridylate synthase